MRAILAAMLLMFATVAYTHDGPAKEHAAAMVFDQSNNTMHIFRGTDHFNLTQYTVEFDAAMNITKVYLKGKKVDGKKHHIYIANDEKFGKILIYNEHGAFMPMQ